MFKKLMLAVLSGVLLLQVACPVCPYKVAGGLAVAGIVYEILTNQAQTAQ